MASRTARDAMLAALRHATMGEYEILAELGRGGMATVYLAHDLALDRKVALKVLAPALLLMGEGMVERFKREARTAAALSHPHIIPIFAVRESEDVLYFVMKHVRGRPLDAVIYDVGPLPIRMVQTILAHVGDALGYAHRHGVIHRDIKSANIMLDDEGWAVVTDFGIAKVEAAPGLTMTGVTVGTPAYMSPEQCAMRAVTGATDQYSLGVVAYEMLTGQLPFKTDSSMSAMFAHVNTSARPVTELRPDCPRNLASAVMRMLEKEPENRWAAMDDVVAICGPSLRRDDPIRHEMITLAKAGPARLFPDINVPTSPIAPTKKRRRPAGRWWIAAAMGIAGLLLWAAPWRFLQRQPSSPGPESLLVARPPPAPRAGARREIEIELAAYARALASLDLNEVRRVYPGLTPSQRDSWGNFFQNVRALQTILTVTALDVRGDTAEARVNGVYDYVDNHTGQSERQTVIFRTILVQDPPGWRIIAIH